MSWQPIDFQGMIELNRRVIGQLEHYLKEKEHRLAHQINDAIHFLSLESFAPTIPKGKILKLSDAVDGLTKCMWLFIKNPLIIHDPNDKGKKVATEINDALWQFTELLEGSAVELFQQVRQIPLNRWHISIAHVVKAIKNLLMHHLDNLIWAVHRLEKPLIEYCRKCRGSKNKWLNWFFNESSSLDTGLLRNLKQTERFLKSNYESFNRRFSEYRQLCLIVENDLEEMKKFPVLALLEMQDQNLYVDVYRLLRMLELNPHPKREIGVETTRALKHLTSIDNILTLFRIYQGEIKDAFYNSSREWKSLDVEEKNFDVALKNLKEKVRDYQHELGRLLHTMSRYRTFILKHHPNSYIGSRWGFTERIVGPEPEKAVTLLHMIYAGEELNNNFIEFSEALSKNPLSWQMNETQARQEINRILHEMGQTLISRTMMRHRAEELLEQLSICDEVGNPKMGIVSYVERILSKAMREDWKYHTLHEFSVFHRMYRTHQNMADRIEDPSHVFRLDHFHFLFEQIEEWVAKEDIYAHVHEIELDINDMKTYLQDFLASIQRIAKESAHDPFLNQRIKKLQRQLLEYRYIFGQFFLNIMSKSQEGIQLRNQFLFVDQYFESAENLLSELKLIRERSVDS